MALEVPAAYQFIQRLRGRTFSIEDVKIIAPAIEAAAFTKTIDRTLTIERSD